MNKKGKFICIISLLLLGLLATTSVFAVDIDISGSTDHVLLFFPRSVTYSTDISNAIDLSKAKSLSQISNDPRVFNESSTDNLSIFRIYDTLDDRYMSIPAYNNGYTVNNYDSGVFQTNNSVVLRIHTTGIFVHTEDPGSTRDFSLSCILSEAHINSSGSEYVLCESEGYVNKTMVPGTTYTLSDKTTQTWFRSLGNGDYELYVPSTPTVKAGNNDYYYPLLLRLFDICIKLETPQAGESLEPGYYTTTITIESETSYTNTLWKGTKTQQQSGRYKIENEVLSMNMSETITVYGYIDDEHSTLTPPEIHQLTVSSSTDTFSMNLGNTSNYYSVAKIDFHSSDSLKSTTDSAIVPDPKQSAKVLARANYYKVYITPSEFTTSSANYGNYAFRKVNNQNETIGYDLYMQTNSGYVQLTGTNSSATYTNCQANPYVSNDVTAIFPESVSVQSVSVNGNLICLTPKFAVNRETYQGNSLTTYNETWSLSNFYLYLKSKYDSQSSGQYTSTLYFTLVTN